MQQTIFGIKEYLSIAVVFGVLIYWTTSFFLIYPLIRFGIGTKPKTVSIVFLVGGVVLTVVSIFLYGQIDFGAIRNTF